MEVRLESSWKELLQEEFTKTYFEQLVSFVRKECQEHTIYPPGKYIFNALDSCPVDQVKVIILGQDPYHGPQQANGLAFSVNDGIQTPPSLINIYKEIESDLGKKMPKSGNLERWAKQGVLLLNATLTVRAHTAASHQNHGWEIFIDGIIKALSDKYSHLVFLLWGNYAQRKGAHIDVARHLVPKAPHPSPLSAYNGFFGCHHFSQANQYLADHNLVPIDW